MKENLDEVVVGRRVDRKKFTVLETVDLAIKNCEDQLASLKALRAKTADSPLAFMLQEDIATYIYLGNPF